MKTITHQDFNREHLRENICKSNLVKNVRESRCYLEKRWMTKEFDAGVGGNVTLFYRNAFDVVVSLLNNKDAILHSNLKRGAELKYDNENFGEAYTGRRWFATEV